MGDLDLEGGGHLLLEGGGALELELIPQTAQQLSRNPNQVRTFQLQVYRNGQWVDVPVQSAQGQVQKNQAGQLTLVMPNNVLDAPRSRLFEGEKVRAYRGVIGAPPVRCWTGYVDVPSATDKIGIIRNPIVTDNIQELNQAILLEGVIYDTFTQNSACVDVINKAIATGQLNLTDDSGTAISSTVNYNLPTGNSICFFPDSINPDGSLLSLASGTLGSFTNGNNPTTSFLVPGASGAAYSAFELPQQYIIASTFQMGGGFTVASFTGSTLPPPISTCVIDFYNGIFYFNPADASRTASFSGFYYSSPLWAFTAGQACADVITQILDKSGARWSVDAFGKFYSRYIDSTQAPTRVLGPSQYSQLQIQTNRDRRNVIICEGWDGNCGQIFTSKCINYDDITNAPPKGLGKRSYMIIQDPAWKTRETINAAVYYAAQQVGRRGKVMSVNIVDDPSLILEDVLCFSGDVADTTEGDFFYVEGIQWNWTLQKNGGLNVITTITGTALPGQGTFYLGPTSATTPTGFFDFSTDILSMDNATLSPTGGTYSSSFSIASGLSLDYEALEDGFEAVDIYGSDGSHLGPFQATRTAGLIGVTLPVGSMNPFTWYVVKLRYEDQFGNIGIFRSFIQAFP